MKHFPIEGCLIVLYPLAQEYIASYLAHYSLRVQTLLHVNDIEEELRYLHECLADNHAFFYVITQKSKQTVIGAIEIRRPTYRSQLYCWLNEQYWGKGYFQEAMQLLADIYFKSTGHAAIGACVDYDNDRSFYALKKAGFQEKRIGQGPYGMQYELILKRK